MSTPTPMPELHPQGRSLSEPGLTVADCPSAAPQRPAGCDSIEAWLRLSMTTGIGPVAVRKLLERFDTAAGVLAARSADLLESITAEQMRALLEPDRERQRAIEEALRWAQAPGCHLLSLADPRYPDLLRQIPDPPPVLFVQGHPDVLSRPAVAIIGSRNASRDGLGLARSIAAALSRAGLVVVSGLAAGIDAAAHHGALDAAGPTVAMVGTGLDRVYPAQHRPLAHAMLADGAIASELPLGAGALAHHFPRRNRLIAGLCLGVVVIQAARQSGSLITARMAAEFGREVMAFPGSIHSPLSKGCHQLIREGAALVEDAAEIARQLSHPLCVALAAQAEVPDASRAPDAEPCRAALSAQATALLDAMGWSPVQTDELAARCRLPASRAAVALLELELARQLERLVDGRFQRLGQHTDSAIAPLDS